MLQLLMLLKSKWMEQNNSAKRGRLALRDWIHSFERVLFVFDFYNNMPVSYLNTFLGRLFVRVWGIVKVPARPEKHKNPRIFFSANKNHLVIDSNVKMYWKSYVLENWKFIFRLKTWCTFCLEIQDLSFGFLRLL